MTNPTIEDFTAKAKAFLDANATPKPEERKFVWGEGSDSVSMFEERDPDKERTARRLEWAYRLALNPRKIA